MSLTEQLAQIRAQAAERIPNPIRKTMEQATKTLNASGIAEKAVGEGDHAPDFTLPNAGGKSVSLVTLLADGPVVMSFYRGGWCPYCNLELKALQERLEEIKALGASLVGISPELPDHTAETVKSDGLGFEVLSDVGNTVARSYGLVFTLPPEIRGIYQKVGVDLVARNGDDSFELPIPATYVIAQDGRVAKAYVDPDYTHRLDPDEIVATLKAL